MPSEQKLEIVETGVPELDVILRGGLPENRLHLIEGAPGTGKTTIAIRYLLNGLAKNKRCLYVTLSESVEELLTAASTHGWNLDGLELFELIPDEARAERQQTVLTISRLIERIEKVNADRLVIESIAEVRMLAQDPLQQGQGRSRRGDRRALGAGPAAPLSLLQSGRTQQGHCRTDRRPDPAPV
jgi:circadian clock protein KaiC